MKMSEKIVRKFFELAFEFKKNLKSFQFLDFFDRIKSG